MALCTLFTTFKSHHRIRNNSFLPPHEQEPQTTSSGLFSANENNFMREASKEHSPFKDQIFKQLHLQQTSVK